MADMWVLEEKDRRVRLKNLRPGLFLWEGVLCFKSEYSTMHNGPESYKNDAYVVESGEYFWGGTDTPAARQELLVSPVDVVIRDLAPEEPRP